MSNALALSEVAMTNDLLALNTIASNMANASTTAYKREITVSRGFDAALDAQASLARSTGPALAGSALGGPTLSTVTDPSQGVLHRTGNPLDVAIEGNAFLELSGAGGTFYTRQGSLRLDAGGTLITTGGMTVNGVDGPIRLTGNDPRIDSIGQVFEGDEPVGQLKLVAFPSLDGLTRVGAGLYAGSGPLAPVDHGVKVRQGFLEASNVPAMEEMVRLITTARHLEMAERVARGYDDMMGAAIDRIADF